MKTRTLLYSIGLIAMFALGHASARIGLPVAHAQGGEKACMRALISANRCDRRNCGAGWAYCFSALSSCSGLGFESHRPRLVSWTAP